MYDHEIPDGMTPADFRAHPVTQLLRDAAHGSRGLPHRTELERLKLPASARRELEAACKRVARTFDEGSHQDAWADGDRAAASILAGVNEELRDPRYLEEPAELPDSPDELADLVPRHGAVRPPKEADPR